MIKPTVPDNEKNRLQALIDLGLLDSEAEERFDQLTRLAASYFNVKICLVSLVDIDRQWFKSKVVLDACETSRDISFCGHAILQNEIMMVPDSRKDHRFQNNPLVTGEPYVIFYAGAPLSTLDGYKVGTLCLIDDNPRTLDSKQLAALRDFADVIEREINNLSQRQLELERHEFAVRTHHMLSVFPDIVFIIGNDFRYVASNNHQDLYLPQSDFIGRKISEVLPHDIALLFENSIKQAFEKNELVAFNYILQVAELQKHFEARAKPISATEALVVVRNTTEDHARRADLERLSMVAKQTTNAVIITDIDKKVLWVNDAFEKISGYSLYEIIGKSPGAVLQGSETNPETIRTMREAYKNKESYSVDIINYNKNGNPYWVRIVCNPWFDNSGELKGYIAIQSDINQEIENIKQIQRNQTLLNAVIDANSIGTWILNLQTRTLEINENWAKILGYTLRELMPVDMDTWQNLTHPDDLKKCLKMFEEYDKGLINYYESPIRMKHKKGEWVWIRTRGSITTRTEDGKAEFSLGTHLDINAQMIAEANLKEQYDYMQMIFENMIDGVVIVDFNRKIQLFNPSSELIFGYSHKEMINQNIKILLPDFDEIPHDGRLQYTEANRKNGEAFPMEIGVVESKYNRETIFVGMLRDVTERKNAEEAIHKLAYFDGLSGLPNRRLMFDRLQQALLKSIRHKTHMAIIFIDFDNFKQINDSLGHDVGDLLLKEISMRLSGLVRESDTVARLGGDEFILILEDLDSLLDIALCQAESVAEGVKAQLNKPYELNGIVYAGSCSIGIAIANEESIMAAELLKQADLAMYQAKLAGKNAIKFFSVEMQEKVNIRMRLEQDLRTTLFNEDFLLFYQSQVDKNGKRIGAEALLRWKHPEQGMISPMQFIPIAEESGLIIPIGRWVLKQACQSLVRWAENPVLVDVILAVNISVVELSQDDWVDSVLNTLQVTGANPFKLKLEVTESVMAFDIEMVITKLTVLRKKGISIALDDFGTGYSSLTYLKSLPLNQLKIDQSFVRDILVDQNDLAIAETIINLAHMMDLDVIAEGVETEEQLKILKDKGCKSFQGYLFGRPEPIETFELASF